MNLEFTNTEGKIFSLGSVSFGFLDKKNTFDKYQENHDEYDSIIFECNNLKGLSKDIDMVVCNSNNLRTDIKKKLIKFAHFIRTSNGVKAVIK